jgi:hypothetical protein
MKKARFAYTEENIYYGRDSRGRNKMIYAFTPLKVVHATDLCCLVKKCGRGQRTEYAVLIDKLKFK